MPIPKLQHRLLATVSVTPISDADADGVARMNQDAYGRNEMTGGDVRDITRCGGLVLIARRNFRPVGYAIAIPMLAEDDRGLDLNVSRLGVLPSHWRQGIGRAIFTRLKYEACSLRYCSLISVVDETDMRSLGFLSAVEAGQPELIRRRAPHVDEVRFRLELPKGVAVA